MVDPRKVEEVSEKVGAVGSKILYSTQTLGKSPSKFVHEMRMEESRPAY